MKRHHRWDKRRILAILCASLLGFSGCAQGGNGAGSTSAADQTGAEAISAADQTGSTGEIAFHPPADTPTVIPGEKEETVYVKADATGKPKETTVEVVLRKITGTDPVEDLSNLREIKNTEGDEEYSSAGDGRYLWENHGEDIHYKGVSEDVLPVDVKTTYYLEGQEVTADHIAGKTGAVRIRFDYENHTEVPFMVLSAVLMDGSVFSDVAVENGRIIDLGEQKAVIGYAFPGLADRLKLTDYEPTEEVELPEFVEISARAVDFALDFTATVVSTGLFDEVKEKDLTDLEDMADDMDELTDASKELVDAAGELADGGAEFGDYLSQYFGGLSQISEGTGALDKGLKALADNIGRITDGSAALQNGLSQMEGSLSKIDLSALGSKESGEAAQAAAAAMQSLGRDTASLSEKLTSVFTAVERLGTFMEYLTTYAGQVEALKTAVDENPAPVLTEIAPDLSENLNNEASSQANAAVKAAAENAVKGVIQDSVLSAVESGMAAAVEKVAAKIAVAAAEQAAQGTADSAKDAVREGIEQSGALDDLGLTSEQVAAAKEQLIGEILNRIEAVPGDSSGLAYEVAAEVSGDISSGIASRITDEITGGITVDPDTVEIRLDELLTQTLSGMQEVLDGKYGNILSAKEEVGELTFPDMSILSAEQIAEISQILGNMGQALQVVSAYAEGVATLSDSLKGLSEGMKSLQSGVTALSKGSEELTGGLVVFKEALIAAADGSESLSSALREVAAAGGELDSAFGELVNGLDAFADGVSEFDEEGIRSLADLTGPEYLEVIRRVRASRDAERSYTNFSGICDGSKGSVRFIIETEEISAGD